MSLVGETDTPASTIEGDDVVRHNDLRCKRAQEHQSASVDARLQELWAQQGYQQGATYIAEDCGTARGCRLDCEGDQVAGATTSLQVPTWWDSEAKRERCS